MKQKYIKRLLIYFNFLTLYLKKTTEKLNPVQYPEPRHHIMMTERINVGIFLNFRTLANVGLSGWFYSEKATGKNLSYL